MRKRLFWQKAAGRATILLAVILGTLPLALAQGILTTLRTLFVFPLACYRLSFPKPPAAAK